MHALLGTNRQCQRTVQLEQCNRRATRCRAALNLISLPRKVVSPSVCPRMEQPDFTASFRIECSEASAFSQRTRHASQREILQYRFAALGHRMNVIDMKRGILRGLRQTTVLASPISTRDDLSSHPCWNAAHAADFRELRERSFKSDRNSAISTNPSASRRSDAFSGVPESCLSSNAVSLFCTPAGSLKAEIPVGTGRLIEIVVGMLYH